MEFSLIIIYYLSAFTMLPDLNASFVLKYLQNPTADDGVALDLLRHDDDAPLLNIDPEQTLDPTPPQQSLLLQSLLLQTARAVMLLFQI